MQKLFSIFFTPEFAKYFTVILFGLAVDIGLLYVLFEVIGIWYLLAAGISFTVALFCNYLLSVRFVFNTEEMKHPLAKLTPFAMVGISALVVSQIGMYVGVDVLTLPVLIAKCLVLPVTFFWNFLLQKHVVFFIPALKE